MTPTWRCNHCGLVNFVYDVNCVRCSAANDGARVYTPPPPAGIRLEDGYILPPPPSGGVWRDGSVLVMTKDAQLPDRCVKCNRPANGSRLKRNYTWHRPGWNVLLFGPFFLYLIIVAIVDKRATIYVGLCVDHVIFRWILIAIGWLLLAATIICVAAGIVFNYPMLAVWGAAILFVAFFWLALLPRVGVPTRIDDRFVWLKGINSNYLAELPPFPGQI